MTVLDLLLEKKHQNNIINKWSEITEVPKKDLKKLWKKAEKIAGKKNYGLIVHIFSRMVTALENVDARKIKNRLNQKYKVRRKKSLNNIISKDD